MSPGLVRRSEGTYGRARDALGSLIEVLKLREGDFGILPGRALSAGALCPIKLSGDKQGPKVTLEPEHPFTRNNIMRMVSKLTQAMIGTYHLKL